MVILEGMVLYSLGGHSCFPGWCKGSWRGVLEPRHTDPRTGAAPSSLLRSHSLSSPPAGLAWSGRALSCQVTAACSSSGSPCRSFPQLIHGPLGRGCGQNGLCFPGPCVPSRRWEARMGPVTKGFLTCDGRDVDRHTAGCFGVGLGRWKSCRLNSLRKTSQRR